MMLGLLRTLLPCAVLVACANTPTSNPAPAPSGPSATGASRAITIEQADRICTTDEQCTAILTECSMCEGACTGVLIDRAARYEGRLDCTAYRGLVCNYDCRPSFKIEAPRCIAGRCESIRVP